MSGRIENFLSEYANFSAEEQKKIKLAIEKMSGNNKEKEEENVSSCPHCGSESFKKHGYKGEKQRYMCKDCKKTFNKTTCSFTQYSKLSDEQWQSLLRGMVKNETVKAISEEIGISPTSTWFNRQKVCAILCNVIENDDKFVDIAECDECFTPSSFKGKRDPAFFIEVLNRLPRHESSYEKRVEY